MIFLAFEMHVEFGLNNKILAAFHLFNRKNKNTYMTIKTPPFVN